MAGKRSFGPGELAAHADQVAHEASTAERLADEIAQARAAADVGHGDAPPFAHLSVRTCYSLRDGAIRPRELTAAAVAAGMTHVVVTDRDGLYGAVRVAQAAIEDGLVPVFGTDLALDPDLDRPGWEVTRAGRTRFAAGERPADPYRRSLDPRARRPAKGPAFLEDDAARVTLLARNQQGYGAVCRAVTAAHLGTADLEQANSLEALAEATTSAARSSPHLPWDRAVEAIDHAGRDGVYALFGVDSPVGRLLAAGRTDAARAELRRWIEVLGVEGVLLGVRNQMIAADPRSTRDHPEPGDDVRARRTLDLAAELGVTPVAVNDVRYLRQQDAHLADVLACVRAQVPIAAHHTGRKTAEGWFKPASVLAPLFAERPDLLANAQRVAESCEVDLGLGQLHVPRLSGMADEVAAGELHRRSWAGVAERFTRLTPPVRERLERELAMVDRLGLHDYFLTVGDIVAGIREMGVLAACRGSAAGSLICYALRISDVDPVEHGLAFERFMNPYRDELPDIDVDVESARREDIYRMILTRYGESRTACVAMVETFQAKMAIREVAKVLGFPGPEIDLLAGSFARVRAKDVRKAIDRLPELKGARLDIGLLETLFGIVERIDGFPRHLALHPCGILLADTTLTDRTPLERSYRGFPMTQFDKDDVAAMGLLKLDVLSVRMLSAMRHTIDLVSDTRGEDLDLADLPTDDPDAYALLRSTRAIGVFQLESPGQRELLGRLQPDRFGDLITEISLFRPGPVKADMVTPFVARRHGKEPVIYEHPVLKPVLAETYGVIVYHEQVMGAVAALTGCDLSYADLVRRQLSDPVKAVALRSWVLACAVDRGIPEEVADAVWQRIASFASFGFCKAHAAAFAIPTYRSAWLKAHYLPEFMAGLLTHDPGMYPRRLILDEARNFGVAVLPPDLNRSASAYTVEVIDQGQADHLLGIRGDRLPAGWTAPTQRPGGSGEAPRPIPPGGWDAGDAGGGYRYALRVGLQDVKGITEDEVSSVVAGRPFASLDEVRQRAVLSRPTAERLVQVGAFDQITGIGRRGGPDRRVVRLAVEELWRDVGRRQLRDPGAPQQARLELDADHEPVLPLTTEAEKVRQELAAIGMDVSRHIVSFYQPLLDHLGVVLASDLADAREFQTVRVAGVKVALQSPPMKTGQRVMFLSLDDRTGATQATFFERTLDDNAWTILHAWLVVVEGVVNRRGASRGSRGITVNGRRAWDLSRLWRAWQEGWLPDALAEKGTPAPHQQQRARPEGLTAAQWGAGAPR